eukprot:5106379-Amphidinium_carterae.1
MAFPASTTRVPVESRLRVELMDILWLTMKMIIPSEERFERPAAVKEVEHVALRLQMRQLAPNSNPPESRKTYAVLIGKIEVGGER